MRRLVNGAGVGLGLALGSGLIYGFFVSEAMRLVMVGIGAFLLAAATIGGTALLVNRQWTKALAAQSHRTIHHHRYPSYEGAPAPSGAGSRPLLAVELLPPLLPAAEQDDSFADEVVA